LYFVLAQLVGAAVASLAINYIYGHANGYGLPAIASGTSTGAGVLAEILGTALLVAVIFGVAVDKRSVAASHPGLPIGLTISAVILSVGPITGAALNPARWFGPALISGDWTNAWVYIVAPIAGALIAGFTYQAVAKPE
jgi:glycerol uptake facilitator-like aquaporin